MNDTTKSRPILFSAPMVRAILAGTKTQTRRVVANPHRNDGGFVLQDYGKGWWPYRSHDGESGCYLDRRKDGDYYSEAPLRCPYGQPGARLWVKEQTLKVEDNGWVGPIYTESEAGQHALEWGYGESDDPDRIEPYDIKRRPSIFMPRVMSRITLELTAVRVERLQDISEADAQAEGIQYSERFNGYCIGMAEHFHSNDPRQSYFSLWEAINGAGSVEANPWVWALEFKRVEAP